MKKLQLLEVLSPGAQRLVDKLTRGTIAPTPEVAKVVRSVLLKGLPNEPKLSSQASLRIDPPGAATLLAYAHKHHLIDDAILCAVGRWPAEEEGWRHLSAGGPPEAVARLALQVTPGAWECIGPEIINQDGDPVPVELVEGNHFTARQHNLLAALCGDQVSFEQTMVLLTWLDHVDWTKVENPRNLGLCLEAAHDIFLTTGLPTAQQVAHKIVSQLWARSLGAPDGGELNGIPWLSLNTATDPDDSGDGSGQKDHDWKRVSRWMTSRSGKGLADWSREFPTWHKANQLYMHAVKCERFAMTAGEQIGGPLGSGVDDWDPTGKVWPQDFVFENKPKAHGVMDPFCIAMDCSTQDLAPEEWTGFFQPRLLAQYTANNRYRLTTSKLPDHHSAGCALLLAGAAGKFI